MILELFDGLGTHSANGDVALLKVWETLQQRLHARGCEEDNHVVVKLLIVANDIAHRAVHDGLGELDAAILRDVELLLVNVAHGVDVSFLVVLGKQRKQCVGMACLGVEDLALAIDDILLQIVCNGLAHAKVLHSVGNIKPQLLAQPEVVVDGGAGSEDHCGVVSDGNL